MQRMISHDAPLPTCSKGHASHHMHDLRRASAGGGHSIECRCSHSARHEDFNDALREWCQMQGVAVPVQPASATVFQLIPPPAAPAIAARDTASAPTVTSLDALQREAITRAKGGAFELADAMELLSAGRAHGGHMAGGI